jgi:serine/threonine-protein kinase RsbT
MAVTASLKLRVHAREDVLWARQEAVRFISALPFDAEEIGRIELTVSELASNMVRHAGGGSLTLTRVERDGRSGVRVVAEDRGPGIPNLEQALKSGFSTGGSLGVGLSAIHDNMDKVEITTREGHGTRVEAEKWLS